MPQRKRQDLREWPVHVPGKGQVLSRQMPGLLH
jgi:hypothetical protein